MRPELGRFLAGNNLAEPREEKLGGGADRAFVSVSVRLALGLLGKSFRSLLSLLKQIDKLSETMYTIEIVE